MTTPPASRRLEAVDALRGIVMVLMALDHTRDFFGVPGQNPTDVATASPALFFTRWITHLCAPTFFLLTGVGAGLASVTRSRVELSRYLIVRGLLLVVLELTILPVFAYQFNADYDTTMLLVIWALGWSMVVLGLLVHLPVAAIATFGIALIVGHNALDGIRLANPLWAILHGPGFVVRSESRTVFAAYPLIPWLGVTAVGYVLARVYTWPAEKRQRFLLVAGTIAVIAFLALRALRTYGDPVPWQLNDDAARSLISFFNATKYPPSLVFLLMTLGPALLILRALDGGVPAWLEPTITYGRAPFFYYFVHFFLIHALAVAVCLVHYGDAHWMFESPDLVRYPFTPPPGWGFTLPVVYSIWIAVVVSLYPLVRRVAAAKATGRYPILSYL